MFRDRLPGHRRALRQLRDRARRSLAKPGKEREPRSRRPTRRRSAHGAGATPRWRDRYCATWRAMFSNCSVQPPSFIRNASARRSGRKLGEAGFGQDEQRAVASLFQPKLDQRRCFCGVIDTGFDGVGMPGVGEEVFGFHLLHHDFHPDVFVTRIGDLTASRLPRDKRVLQFHAKPFGELPIIG